MAGSSVLWTGGNALKHVSAECLLHQHSLRWEARDTADTGSREREILYRSHGSYDQQSGPKQCRSHHPSKASGN